ncbi:MetQ/NlpA family ABC transporter substrate-binding protein [Rhodoferax sp.]|uniref:MetQ/NlpA family ABC transporter substrate-binding protein n=1 Tax=Rhodoferax sp. TaxID=50421 RepID=UPI0025EAB814|nr:MetQ/NlpA family ABC transporter substrate-binding protein [Rhodoferax sp.]
MKRRALLALGLGTTAFAVRAQPCSVSVGVMPGPHAEIMTVVQQVAADAGLNLRLLEQDAGRGVNAEVLAGRLDAACFQDAVAFNTEAVRHPGALAIATPTVTLPFALYSRRVAHPRQLAHGSTLAIPRERAAASRALVLLHNFGLVALRDGSGLTATPRDVVGNRYGFKLLSLPQDQLAGALPRVDAAVIDRPHAGRAGLQPGRDSIGLEDARSPWTDVLAVRGADRSAAWVNTLVASYRSEPVKRFILEHFQDSVRRPW